MENEPQSANAPDGTHPTRYVIMGDLPLSGAILQDRIDYVRSFAKELMELQGSPSGDPSEALDALLDVLQETSRYFNVKADSGAVKETRICHRLREALLLHLRQAISAAKGDGNKHRALIDLRRRYRKKLALGLWAAGPVTQGQDTFQKPPPKPITAAEAIGKRKTQRPTFFGEYVSTDNPNNEEVYRARLELMRIVKPAVPKFLENLSCDVLPLYEQLAKGGYSFDRILWTNSSPYALLKEDGGLKAALSKWAAEFNAEAEWVMDGALRTLRFWHVAPDALESLRWETQGAYSGTLVIGEAFEFRHPAWEVNGQTWQAYRESLGRLFEEMLKKYERATRKLAESQGLVRARRQYSPDNLKWFVLYQFGGLSSVQIAEHLAKSGCGCSGESTILKGVKAAAKLIAWDHLREPKQTQTRKCQRRCKNPHIAG